MPAYRSMGFTSWIYSEPRPQGIIEADPLSQEPGGRVHQRNQPTAETAEKSPYQSEMRAFGYNRRSRPSLLDDVGKAFPELKVLQWHAGFPWIDECLVLVAKHPNF